MVLVKQKQKRLRCWLGRNKKYSVTVRIKRALGVIGNCKYAERARKGVQGKRGQEDSEKGLIRTGTRAVKKRE